MVDFEKLGSILGINRRNLDFIQPHNPRSAFPLVDDKTKTKKILSESGIPVPRTLAVVDSLVRIPSVIDGLMDEDAFVVKPARGRAGGGVLLVERKPNGSWQTPSGREITTEGLRRHLADILFGVYSFGRMGDSALVEERVVPHEFFKRIYGRGIPDIRVITYGGTPIVSMLRVPTDRSDGKANLHQGAIGVGIDTSTGQTTGGVYRGKTIANHPNSGQILRGLSIPYWGDIMNFAIQAAGTVPLGYLGIDFVIDSTHGPLILELNARPGLQIQVVNQTGIVEQLREISG